MKEIIRVLLNEGIEREDVVAICKYIKEEYVPYTKDEMKGLTPKAKKWLNTVMNQECNNGIQLKTYTREGALQNAQAMSKQEIEKKNALKQGKKEFEKNHPKQEQTTTVIQKGLFDN